MYNTHRSQADGVVLEVPCFGSSVYKSTKHFGLSFANDAPKLWSGLPDDICSAASSLSSSTSLFAKA